MTIYRTWLRSTDEMPENLKKDLREARKRVDRNKIVPDEDCPEISDELLMRMVQARRNRKQNPSMRVTSRVKLADPKELKR